MQNDKIINAFNNIQPDNEIKNRVFDKALQKQRKKRPALKVAVSFAAAAAVICLVILGSGVLAPKEDLIFTVKAYAMEVLEDSTVQLSEVDIIDSKPEYWGGYVDGETRTMYVGLGLRCEGEDVESVEFSTDSGFFAKQYIGNLSEISTEGMQRLHVGPEGRMVMFGTDFEDDGSTIILDKETVDDYLLFWGSSYTDDPEAFLHPSFPKEITLHAKATFTNGKTAEKDVAIDLSGTGMASYRPSEEELAQNKKDHEAYRELLQSIPFDKCEVVPDSVQTLTYGDTYEYHLGDPRFSTSYKPITEEAMEAALAEGLFNENGIFRIGSTLPDDGSDGYIAVLERSGDDTFTGTVYKVPGQLIWEYKK